MSKDRIYLSPPNIGSAEKDAIIQTLESGWVAPVGPALKEFEKNLEHHFNDKRVLLLNSGTSALHLSLVLAGVAEGDHVITSSFTFAACANVIRYQGAIPVFMDSESQTWNLDPDVLESYLRLCDVKPKIILVTHLYGMPAQIEKIRDIATNHEIVLVEDAAEALGSTYKGTALGQFGSFGVISFNGNKIITTSGGGALVTNNAGYEHGLHLATQANSGIKEYHHEEKGFNYRMSNVLAGLGMGQIGRLQEFVSRKRQIHDEYKGALSDWFDFTEEGTLSKSNRWLTVALLKTDHSIDDLIEFLEDHNIESRKLWKPLHMHPAYSGYEFIGSGFCEELFKVGICLPSGTGLTTADQQFVIEKIRQFVTA